MLHNNSRLNGLTMEKKRTIQHPIPFVLQQWDPRGQVVWCRFCGKPVGDTSVYVGHLLTRCYACDR